MTAKHSQYLRAETRAGGLSKSTRQFIRATRTMLSPEGKRRGARSIRHTWTRDMLAIRAKVLDSMR